MRAFHRWPGLLAAAFLIVLSLSGATLALFPAAERLSAATGGNDPALSVATLVDRVQAEYPGVEQIKRAPSGQITAYWFADDMPGAATIDPTTGAGIGSVDTSPTRLWLTNLHRSLFLDDTGRITMAVGAGAMLILSISGLFLVARRTGGWRRFLAPLKGPLSGRIHVEIARVAVVGLTLSSLTALWMTAATFSLLPESDIAPAFPTDVSGQVGVDPAAMAELKATPVSQLRTLTFPYPGDATDVFTLETDKGTGFIDQGTGTVLVWQDLSLWAQVNETIYMLHTGQGAPLIGVILGLMALGVPLMATTGIILWLAGRRSRPRIRGNAPAGQAQTIVLVGSESGSTWGFAATLHKALTAAGQKVHVAPMSGFTPARYGQAERIIALAATYGDGAAPASAKGFLDRLDALVEAPAAPLAVLGFGDRGFAEYCGFANEIAARAEAMGWTQVMPMDTVNRQSPQDFLRWGRALGATMGLALELNHHPVAPRTTDLTLLERRDYGAAMQAPTAILRFALPNATIWQNLRGRGMARFNAGDLIGILPEGSDTPRFYSLASSSRDGFAEICVRKHPGGLCSGQLIDLAPGSTVHAFIRRNPTFRPAKGKADVILIGAGTGIGPLAGFVRGNAARQPMHLFFGARHPDSDLLYERELDAWQADGRLQSVVTAFSRTAERAHVQDALRREAAQVAHLIAAGAQVMVCGGRDMAAGVTAALADILAPHGLTPAMLKAEGRYAEDVY